MQPLKLTPEHRIKLLKMAKALFPEYKSIFITPCEVGIGGIDLNNSMNVIELCKNKNANFGNKHIDDIAVHWFEFCTVQIFLALYRSRGDMDKYMNNLFNYTVLHNGSELKIHPVDYLYTEFKNLQ